MRRQILKTEAELRHIQGKKHSLHYQRSAIEQKLQQTGEQYRIGAIGFEEYNKVVEDLLGTQTREQVYAHIDGQILKLEKEEQRLQNTHSQLAQELPSHSTMNGMQMLFALIAITALIGGIFILDHPEGMVVYEPQREEENTQTNTLPTTVEQTDTKERANKPWQTTTSPEPHRAP